MNATASAMAVFIGILSTVFFTAKSLAGWLSFASAQFFGFVIAQPPFQLGHNEKLTGAVHERLEKIKQAISRPIE
jgi:hypothetical protein